MKQANRSTFVSGTSALKQQNATARIVAFPERKDVPDFLATDYKSLARARHATKRDKAASFALGTLQKSRAVQDILTGDLRGSHAVELTAAQYAISGIVYSAIILASIFLAI